MPYLSFEIENTLISSYSGGGSGEKGGTDDLLIGGQTDFEPLATAFPGFTGGVRVASGDVNGDDGDVLVGAGPGVPGGHVKVFSGVDWSSGLVEEGHPGGGNVCMGDGSVRFLRDGLLLPAVQPAIDNLGIQPPADAGGTFQISFSQQTTPPAPQAGEPSAPSISEIVVTKVTDSSTPLFMEDDTFDFQPQFTTAPTAPEAGGGHKDWIIVESYQFLHNGDDGVRDVLVGVSGLDWNLSPDTMTAGPDGNLGLPAADGLLLPY